MQSRCAEHQLPRKTCRGDADVIPPQSQMPAESLAALRVACILGVRNVGWLLPRIQGFTGRTAPLPSGCQLPASCVSPSPAFSATMLVANFWIVSCQSSAPRKVSTLSLGVDATRTELRTTGVSEPPNRLAKNRAIALGILFIHSFCS